MPPPPTPRPGRLLAITALIVIALYAGVFLGSPRTPQLGLDLIGGTTVTLTPRLAHGGTVSKSALSKAVDIIRQRVNGLGVSEAQVSTEGTNIIVSVPGKGRSQVIDLVGRTAQLRFRQVLEQGVSTPTPTPTPSAKPTKAPTPGAKPSAKAASPTPSPSATALQAPTAAALQQRYATIDCHNPKNRQGGGFDNPNLPLVACGMNGNTKYLLAPAKVLGSDISSANATIDSTGLGSWLVNLTFNNAGAAKFGALTKQVQPLPPPTNEVAIVLDGVVQSAPVIQTPILTGQAQITGNFTQQEAQNLANVLKYGALPLSFTIPTAQTVSPTLGSSQLAAGLLAGLIGLGLVIAYSLLYYRGLGLVTVASLALSGVILYAATTLLGRAVSYTLTLAGIAGFIVAVGITADSFVVLFERLRDEVRDGRSLRSAVERAWPRARRTIISADTVSILAALVLYLVSIGDVRGFAFTLGLSTIVDLLIVFLFTKPLITVLARTRIYGGQGRFSGLSPSRLGARVPVVPAAAPGTGASAGAGARAGAKEA